MHLTVDKEEPFSLKLYTSSASTFFFKLGIYYMWIWKKYKMKRKECCSYCSKHVTDARRNNDWYFLIQCQAGPQKPIRYAFGENHLCPINRTPNTCQWSQTHSAPSSPASLWETTLGTHKHNMTTHFRDEENEAQGGTDVPKGTLQGVAKTQQTAAWPWTRGVGLSQTPLCTS